MQNGALILRFTEELFTIAMKWQQPKYSSVGKESVAHHTMEYYSANKKEWNPESHGNMDGNGDHYVK